MGEMGMSSSQKQALHLIIGRIDYQLTDKRDDRQKKPGLGRVKMERTLKTFQFGSKPGPDD